MVVVDRGLDRPYRASPQPLVARAPVGSDGDLRYSETEVALAIVVLSGRIAVGKSTLARGLTSRYGGRVFRTNELIQQLTGSSDSRRDLQQLGKRLEIATGGRWVADALVREMSNVGISDLVVVDAVRRRTQLEPIRAEYGPIVRHVHLTADNDILAARYVERRTLRPGDADNYGQVFRDEIERQVDALASVADVVIDNSHEKPADVLRHVTLALGLGGPQK